MKSFAIRLEKNGIINVPQTIQDKLNICEGDLLNLIEIEGIILLTLQQPKVPQLSDQITTIREEANVIVISDKSDTV
ncbi:AbrB/MazE/SpoVT family DNA-binding domain-containing protein [Microcystis aeruginosa]|uniref:AbrB/MazE/SpoVT family DNA-binding domain-containing protein n=1 Tax=Microcystis aeruginosa Ma_QC_C_20070703_M131 TaxID=2486263 RepID=A0A551XZ70_MICAE|nr:AbrB/MazE/SpoVT family DNA-binding domain-containing protein [Microcystis aeruginosa]MDB9391156.1 AbrB/MazE/SpoVT family DNA-binding domain-containing protein [Microcystis aeruginosa CS-579]TRT54019.1 MAG: AbrB/MazE/SpoVT family DNA-binding domain-containing protein [Microcystis aeruginosa Ma_QC_C_20070703_M131]